MRISSRLAGKRLDSSESVPRRSHHNILCVSVHRMVWLKALSPTRHIIHTDYGWRRDAARRWWRPSFNAAKSILRKSHPKGTTMVRMAYLHSLASTAVAPFCQPAFRRNNLITTLIRSHTPHMCGTAREHFHIGNRMQWIVSVEV